MSEKLNIEKELKDLSIYELELFKKDIKNVFELKTIENEVNINE